MFGVTDPILEFPQVPFQPWAKAVYVARQSDELEPHTRCHPSGVAREFLTPYGVEFVEMPELQRLYIFDEGGPHTFRTIYMDGRSHPKDLVPSYYGHSVGRWEGDTLVVDTVALSDKSFIDGSSPHSPKMTVHERIRFVEPGVLEDQITVNDPVALTEPWHAVRRYRKAAYPNDELREFACAEGLRDRTH
jgi:hypothetical protein